MLPYQLHQRLRQAQQGNLSDNFNPRARLTSPDPELEQLKGLPFWNWNVEEHRAIFNATNGNCCFNHCLGLPIKNNKEFPIFDFQKLIFDALENLGINNIWIKKARGIGVTTFMIRYLVWKILSSKTGELDGKSIFIISGTREEFANYVKKKMEDLFLPRFPNIIFDSKYTELWINKTWIKVMPTKNIKDVRGYMDVAYLFIDEADHFDKSIQEELEPAITAYEEKSKGKTIMASTPNSPGGLYEKIEKDSNSKYTKLFLGYEYGLDKIYDRAFIERKKLEPEFEREYNLKYLGRIGNVFSPIMIDKAVLLGEQFSLDKIPINDYVVHSIGVDPGFSSSRTAIVVTERLKEQNKIRVLESIEYEKPNPSEIANIIFDLSLKYRNSLIWIDGANAGMVNELKIKFNEEYTTDTIEPDPEQMKILPVNFGTEHKRMLSNLHLFISKEYLCIPSKFEKLLLSLRTAYANEYSLDKNETSYSDSLDALRLSLKSFKID